jgi:hypothetical protein
MEHNIHFISYGDEKFKASKRRIYNEAVNTGWFNSIKCYGKEDLSIEFCHEFKNILSMNRGGGYWIWKFDIILNKLQEINDNEFLIYADCGCTINPTGYHRLNEYIEMIKNNRNKIISFQLKHMEKVFTTKQIFESFNIPENHPIETSRQYVGGILIMQKCNNIINIFKDCLDKLRKNPLLITNYYNNNQRSYFKDNRYDQSILSVARKIHGSIILPDETWNINYNAEQLKNAEDMKKFPFLATRIRY